MSESPGICKYLGCESPARAKGYCIQHYDRVRRDLVRGGPGRSRKLSNISDLHKHAAARGGQSLTDVYTTSMAPYEWVCQYGHRWSASWMHVEHSNSWCPICGSGRGERMARYILEEMFGCPFPRSRPRWLADDDGKYPLELDGLNEVKRIAFEYQGRQHYEVWGNYSESDVEELAIRDQRKRTRCWDMGVSLIVIPGDRNPTRNIERFINQIELAVLGSGIKIPRGWKGRRPTTIPDVGSNRTKATTNEMHEYAASRGGRCLSETYTKVIDHLVWECASGHQWSARWDSVRNGGHWCIICANVIRWSAERDEAKRAIITILEARGGKCLSEEYNGVMQKLEWECSDGHRWNATLNNVKKGTWCPRCSAKGRWATRRNT